MPNEKQRKKKGGRNKSTKLRAMKRAVRTRYEQTKFTRASNDQVDIVKFKPGSARDRTSRVRQDQRAPQQQR